MPMLHRLFNQAPHLLPLVEVMAISAILSLLLASKSRTHFVRTQGFLLSLPIILLMVDGLYFSGLCMMEGLGIPSLLGGLLLIVLAFGAILICSPDVAIDQKGQLVVREPSLFYSIIYEWGQIDPKHNMSLWAISWIMAPQLAVAIVFFGAIALTIVSVFLACWIALILTMMASAFFIQGREPFSEGKYWFHKVYGPNPTPPRRYWGGWRRIPYSPLLWLLALQVAVHLHRTLLPGWSTNQFGLASGIAIYLLIVLMGAGYDRYCNRLTRLPNRATSKPSRTPTSLRKAARTIGAKLIAVKEGICPTLSAEGPHLDRRGDSEA